MQETIKAVIFDMDGVLIESEHLWQRAMIRGFREYGMLLSEDDCRKTMGLRIGEVIERWIAHFGVREVSASALEKRILDLLLDLITESGVFIQGIPALLAFCREKRLKIGLATSSSERLMQAILKKLDLSGQLDATLSAEHLPYGKPHPEVFLLCARALEVSPLHCLVIEDSLNGVIAAKAAQMKVIAVPDDAHTGVAGFAVADYRFANMHEVLDLFKELFSASPVSSAGQTGT
jgi:beta-phosphoglucomutase-like phosphatase (HAD superfamily)